MEIHEETGVRETPDEEVPFHVVAIGASAGGLPALEELFANMAPDLPAAYIVIQHLSPNFESKMDELLSRQTQIPIVAVEDGMTVEPGRIYLPPPRADIIMSGGKLLLTERPKQEVFRLPIDHFFRSLAQDVGRCAVGIVLSGTGSDGSRGIGEIHEAGGLVMAQTSETARFDGMPRNARSTGMVDLVLSPHEMADALSDYIGHYASSASETMFRHGREEEDTINAIIGLLKDRNGIDFFEYKPTTVARRIWRRVALSRAGDIKEYHDRLQGDPTELGALHQDLLIGVTRFFRDEEAFSVLASEVIPKLVRNAEPDAGLRVWVPACTTGEEVYTLGSLFLEAIEADGREIPLKIFATDVDETALVAANKAQYTTEALADFPANLREKYFRVDQEGYYRVRKKLRECVVFARHDVLIDPPFTGLDFLSCRNLLIYLKPPAQKKVLMLFHFGLRRDGVLFLGSSETPGALADEFDTVNGKHRVFRKRRDVRLAPEPRLYQTRARPVPMVRGPVSSVGDSRLLAVYEQLIGQHVPPSFLVDQQRCVVHAFSGAEDLVQFRGGRMSTDILELVHPDLKMAVAGALRHAEREGEEARYSGVTVGKGGEDATFEVTAVPVTLSRSDSYYLVTLEEMKETAARSAVTRLSEPEELDRDYIESIESELRYTQENLQATVEELETSNEELQATNEELVASNEELQSTNEELHSVNEELYTVNSEYQEKIDELTRLTDDFDNLFESLDVAVVFLDSEMRVRKFTKQAAPAFNLIPQDVGRKFDNFSTRIAYDGLDDVLHGVCRRGEPFATEVVDDGGRWHFLRVLPYRTSEEEISGVVVTMIDISQMKRAHEQVKRSVQQRDVFLAMLSHELRNPLMALLTASRLFLDQDSKSDQKEKAADVVRRQTLHMARLLDDLLDVSRMRQDRIQMLREEFDLRDTIPDVLDEVRSRAEDAGVGFDIDIADEPLIMLGDRARMKQLQANLLTNAFKFTERGGLVRFTVKRDGEGGEVVIAVEDDGEGIDPVILDSIFDPFVQGVEGPSNGDDVGLGLGLSLVDAVARAHGGSVTAKSDGAGRGSLFEVRIPFCASTGAEASSAAPTNGVDRTTPHRVLFVEDQRDSRELMEFALRSFGYEVVAVGTGREALQKLETEKFSIGVIDVGLPDMTGLDVARAARERQGARMRLLAVTGHGRQKDRDRIIEAGFDQHLVKPVDIDDLVATIEGEESA